MRCLESGIKGWNKGREKKKEEKGERREEGEGRVRNGRKMALTLCPILIGSGDEHTGTWLLLQNGSREFLRPWIPKDLIHVSLRKVIFMVRAGWGIFTIQV